MASLVWIAAARADSLVALALVAGPVAVERALAATCDLRPMVTYTEPRMAPDRYDELDRLMRRNGGDRLGSEV